MCLVNGMESRVRKERKLKEEKEIPPIDSNGENDRK